MDRTPIIDVLDELVHRIIFADRTDVFNAACHAIIQQGEALDLDNLDRARIWRRLHAVLHDTPQLRHKS